MSQDWTLEDDVTWAHCGVLDGALAVLHCSLYCSTCPFGALAVLHRALSHSMTLVKTLDLALCMYFTAMCAHSRVHAATAIIEKLVLCMRKQGTCHILKSCMHLLHAIKTRRI